MAVVVSAVEAGVVGFGLRDFVAIAEVERDIGLVVAYIKVVAFVGIHTDHSDFVVVAADMLEHVEDADMECLREVSDWQDCMAHPSGFVVLLAVVVMEAHYHSVGC